MLYRDFSWETITQPELWMVTSSGKEGKREAAALEIRLKLFTI